MTDRSVAPSRRRDRLILGVLLGILLGLLIVAMAEWATDRAPETTGPPWTLPDVRLIDSSGSDYFLTSLRGRVWIAGFFFTRCQSICPRLIADQAGLAQRLDEAGLRRIHLVSISVDPAHDTPEQLQAYGDARGIDFDRWTLLTGSPDDVRRLVESGFRIAMGIAPPEGVDLFDIAHTARLALVGPDGVVSGFYETDRAGLDAIFRDGAQLAAKHR